MRLVPVGADADFDDQRHAPAEERVPEQPCEAEVHRGFDREAFWAQLTQAGFRDIHLETVCEVEKENRRYPVFLALARRD